MATTYLIDFENVNDLGMNGIHELPEGDRVYIIYTNNANRICLDWFDGVSASISVVRVESGNQSLDMHLVSFLGYLLGQEESTEDHYVIISQDTDYIGVASFWCSRYGDESKVLIYPSICICSEGINSLRSTPISNHDVLVDRIRAIIQKHGEYSDNGSKMMRVSLLCTYLNKEPSFLNERERLNLKGMKLLTTCNDVIEIILYNKAEWAILSDGRSFAQPNNADAECSNAMKEEPARQQQEHTNEAEKQNTEDIDEVKEIIDQGHPADLPFDQLPCEESVSVQKTDTVADAPEEDESSADVQKTQSDSITEITADIYTQAKEAIRAKGYPDSLADEVAALIGEGIHEKAGNRVTIYRSFLKKYGRNKGCEYYSHVKWLPF